MHAGSTRRRGPSAAPEGVEFLSSSIQHSFLGPDKGTQLGSINQFKLRPFLPPRKYYRPTTNAFEVAEKNDRAALIRKGN
jgi:hypothetical protein